jgi:glutathione peroxidase-family protein
MSHVFDDLNLKLLDGGDLPHEAFAGRPLLIVNVASKCGLTPQYTELVALHEELKDQGGGVLGVPCNQFGGQEPGTADEIQAFCSTTYGVDFPLLAKQDVNGDGRSPLYQRLVGDGDDIQWNFEKFIVDGEGKVVERFEPTTAPNDERIKRRFAVLLGL